MNEVIQLIAAFIMVLTFGIMYQAPPRSLFMVGLTGMVSWAGFLLTESIIENVVISSFIAASIVGLCGELFARIMRLPVTVFVIAGILPLVPGTDAYNTMLHLIKNEYIEGVRTGIDTLMIAGAIAFAVAMVSALAKSYKGWRDRRKYKTPGTA